MLKINPYLETNRFLNLYKKVSKEFDNIICVKYRSYGKAVYILKREFRGPGFEFGGLKLKILIFPDSYETEN